MKKIKALYRSISAFVVAFIERIYSFIKKIYYARFKILRALILISLGLLLWIISSSLYPYITGKAFGYTQIGDNPFPRDIPGKIRMLLNFNQFDENNIRAKEIGGDVGLVVEIHEVSIAPSFTFEAKKNICIDSIELRPTTTRTQVPFDTDPFWGGVRRSSSSHPQYSFDSFCTGQEFDQVDDWKTDKRVINGGFEYILPANAIPSFYYPFDKRTIILNILINGYYQQDGKADGKLLEINPELIDIVGFVTALEWDEKISIQNTSLSIYDGNEQYHDRAVKKIVIEYQRPLFNRILTIVLLGALIIFSIALAFIKELSAFLEAGVGILLGLWGVQDMLIPRNINGPFLITSIIMLIYLLLILAVAFRFVIRPLWVFLSDHSTIHEGRK